MVPDCESNSNPFSSTYDRGNCDTDIRHSYVGTVLYELPWFRDQNGFVGHVLGGFSISSVMTLQTGLPFDITDSGDRSLTGAGDDRPDYIGGNVQFVDPRANAFGLLNSYFNGTGGGTDYCAPAIRTSHRVGSGAAVVLGRRPLWKLRPQRLPRTGDSQHRFSLCQDYPYYGALYRSPSAARRSISSITPSSLTRMATSTTPRSARS